MDVPEMTNNASGAPTAELSSHAELVPRFYRFLVPVPQFIPKSQLEFAEMTTSPGATTSGLIRFPIASPIEVNDAKEEDEKMVLASDQIRKKT